MRRSVVGSLLLAGVGVCLPWWSDAQDIPVTGLSTNLHGLQGTLEQVYNTLLAKCGALVDVGRAIAGLGSLLYVSYRVWGHIARAEAIDLFPLLRPFALGMLLVLYPSFIGLINGVLQPTVTGTAALVNDENAAITRLLQQKQAAIEQSSDWQMYIGPDGSGSQEKWEQYSGQAETGMFSGVSNSLKFALSRMMYNLRNSIKVVISEILQLIYEAAALCINTLRTFELVLFAILGPLAIAISSFDGFKHVFIAWLGRYINVFLWLPICNIFSSLCGQIQVEMIKIDIQQMQASGQTSFGSTDTAYMIFLIIAICGYFCIPSIASHVISVFPSGGGALLSKVSGAAQRVPAAVIGSTPASSGGAGD